MAEKKPNLNLDPEMLANLDLMLNMDIVEEEESWQLLQEVDESGEDLDFFSDIDEKEINQDLKGK